LAGGRGIRREEEEVGGVERAGGEGDLSNGDRQSRSIFTWHYSGGVFQRRGGTTVRASYLRA